MEQTASGSGVFPAVSGDQQAKAKLCCVETGNRVPSMMNGATAIAVSKD
ncbi:hypothetical protein KIF24_04785 [Micromonospora sp. Llam7]|nr:hypothetical protein [Micromonospora tarapacensis]